MLITWSRKFWNATKASSPMTRGIWIIPTPVKDKFMIENRKFHLLKIMKPPLCRKVNDNTLLWRLRRASEAAAVGTPCPRPHIFHSTEFELKKRKMQELSKKCYQSTFTKSQLLQNAAARCKGNRWIPRNFLRGTWRGGLSPNLGKTLQKHPSLADLLFALSNSLSSKPPKHCKTSN